MKQSRYNIGVILAIGSAVCFALSNTFAGLAYQGGATPFTLSASRFLLPAALLLMVLLLQKQPLLMAWRHGLGAGILGVVTIIYTLALLTAIDRLPTTIAILIFYLFPIFTGAILAVTGWDAFGRTKIIGVLIAFLGLALTLGVRFGELDGLGMILAAIAAAGLATVSSVSSRLIGGADPRQATLYISVAASLTMLMVVAIRGKLEMPVDTTGWTGFWISNLLYAAAMIGFFYAIALIGAGAATFFSNFEPLVVTIASFLLLGQSLLPLQLVGVVVVVGALIFYAKADTGQPPELDNEHL
ncbi:MAG: DMT family transporter [Rhodospirillales bacterium]|nr:DMT family transporter [Rhodospirillales bacterium]